ncbi:MAG TPA: hypothetical protein VKC52_00515 [Acidimicrobiia bacterium]|nr:hypothetical protein [Acidimicrobiia bacterium]
MGRIWAFAAVCATVLMGAPASAPAATPPPGAAISDNLEYVARVPGTGEVVEGKFDDVAGREVLVLTGRFGFKTFDVSDPADPKPLDSFIPSDLAAGGYWQNEDMELDTRRKLIIGALDPRHTDNPLGLCPAGGSVRNVYCRSGFYVISYADPTDLRQVGDFVELPSGHTSSCIDQCRYIWTGGPARRDDQGWLGPILTEPRLIGDGRPIWVTDLTDPSHPKVSDDPIDLWRNDGYTDYSHDVNVDRNGIAWVSGRGGIRGWATAGLHRDPYADQFRQATPIDPVLVAGGGVGGTAQPVMFMHNSERPTGDAVVASGVATGNVLVGTEEDFTRPCGASGKIVLSDLTDSWGGEGSANSTLEIPYRMKPLDTFHPFVDTPETANPDLGCSAHYFEIRASTLAGAWYGQGLRLLDVSDARNVRQIGYYRVTGTDPATNPSSNSWDTEWRNNRIVYLFDMTRGVEILRLKKDASASATMPAVTAPSVESDSLAAQPIGSLDGSGRFVCPLFTQG